MSFADCIHKNGTMVIMNKTMNQDDSMMQNHAVQHRTFLEALEERYVDQNEYNQLSGPDDIIIQPESDATFFGFNKLSSIQSQLRGIFSLDLAKMSISSAGNVEKLGNSLSRVHLLNLACNSLTWADLVTIINCLPNVKEIVFTQNNLKENAPSLSLENCKKLKSLTLGKTHMSWDTIVHTLSQFCLSVEELDLWSSDLSEDDMTLHSSLIKDRFVRGITSLRLSQNNFHNIDWIGKLGPIDNLTDLDLSRCHLKTFAMDEDVVKKLSQLTSLNISYNLLGDWQDISNLFKLKKLKEFICHENPFFTSEKFAKYLTVGRLGSIKVINREPINKDARKDAELLYLRKTFSEYKLFVDGKNDSFKVAHPRYDELIELYGLPEDLNKNQSDEKYITVDLCYGDKKVNRKLPCDMRVSIVQMLCKRLFKLRASNNIKLMCRNLDPNSSMVEYELDKDGQTLHFFSVKSGFQLVVFEE